jgi:hypothetical protein
MTRPPIEDMLKSYSRTNNPAHMELAYLCQYALALEAAAERLCEKLDTCHICKGLLHLDDVEPTHCEDCSRDCDEHDEPNCESLGDSVRALRDLLRQKEAHDETTG